MASGKPMSHDRHRVTQAQNSGRRSRCDSKQDSRDQWPCSAGTVANTVGIMSDDDAAPDASSPDTEPIVTGAPRRRWKVPVVGLTAVALLTVATMVPFVLNDHRSFESYSVKTSSASVERWWADNHGEVEALQTAISDVQHALTIVDAAAVSAGCQRMHDAAELKLKASLPTPQADLTTDVAGAIEDAHSAAHMCLAAEAGTSNNYAGEFRSEMEQAQRQLRAAQDLVNKLLTA